MSEIVNVVVAFAVIVFVVRWATRGGGDREQARRARNLLGFQPKHVTTEMISIVQSMFPHIPRENIHYDLLRTGSVEVTSNKLLERGFLEAPPPNYFQLFPAQPAPIVAASSSTASSSTGRLPGTAASSSKTPRSTLITRFDLQNRVDLETNSTTTTTDAGGKATWEDTAEGREASLRERKAQMVLAARKRLREEQQRQAMAVPP